MPYRVSSFKRIEKILETGPFDIPEFPRCVHRSHFLYELRWSQAGARINEMEASGWTISHVTLPERLWRNGIQVAYRLDSKPLGIPPAVRAPALGKPASNDDSGERPESRSERAERLFGTPKLTPANRDPELAPFELVP